ncbi:ROK family protein [Granulicella sibirica]|uniref:N-acetyl-D-glucosamine kinase n=1 Tax=Granulicella sibirica TaxID=2479048 RepID=A0A4Q0T907_9BACT|nr:ROK family protein [Granulicella sibirica]RXH58658.1 N-acetyl-D-glucosamine kinase [Granulicella sibirica]
MAKSIGVTLSERVVAGLVVDHKLAGPMRVFPEAHDDEYALVEMPADAIMHTLCQQIIQVADGATDIVSVGVGVPGVIRNGVVEEAPNLAQLKGARFQEVLGGKLKENGLNASVNLLNDADGFAAGIAATHGRLDSIVRVWTLGVGIGFGRYPFLPGAWEGGHTTVTLDDKENYCGCGGRGHMEGIMGHRAMRLRFLDMEPEEVFEAAAKGDARCLDFKRLWHKALAAGTATSIHLDGPGKFFIAGFNVRFVDLSMLKDYIQRMVKMSPLQAYSLEIVQDDAETRIIGAAVAAEQAATR